MAAQVRMVERRGTVADLHGADLFANLPSTGAVIDVVVCRPTHAAIALGSRQRPDQLDHEACARAGVEIAVRRSGGGAVVIEPDRVVWIDIVVPPRLVPVDVRASMVWIGESWGRALDACLSIDDRCFGRDVVRTVYRGGMVKTPWSDLVCFAGVGPGEVLVGDRKLVGLSQRRTRLGARFQGLVYVAEPVTDVAGLFSGPVPDALLPSPATAPTLDSDELAHRLAESLELP